MDRSERGLQLGLLRDVAGDGLVEPLERGLELVLAAALLSAFVVAPGHRIGAREAIATRFEQGGLGAERVHADAHAGELAADVGGADGVLAAADAADTDAGQRVQLDTGGIPLLDVLEVLPGGPALNHGHPGNLGREAAQLEVVGDRPALVLFDAEAGLGDDARLTHPVLLARELELADLGDVAAHSGDVLGGGGAPRAIEVELGEAAAIECPAAARLGHALALHEHAVAQEKRALGEAEPVGTMRADEILHFGTALPPAWGRRFTM